MPHSALCGLNSSVLQSSRCSLPLSSSASPLLAAILLPAANCPLDDFLPLPPHTRVPLLAVTAAQKETCSPWCRLTPGEARRAAAPHPAPRGTRKQPAAVAELLPHYPLFLAQPIGEPDFWPVEVATSSHVTLPAGGKAIHATFARNTSPPRGGPAEWGLVLPEGRVGAAPPRLS